MEKPRFEYHKNEFYVIKEINVDRPPYFVGAHIDVFQCMDVVDAMIEIDSEYCDEKHNYVIERCICTDKGTRYEKVKEYFNK